MNDERYQIIATGLAEWCAELIDQLIGEGRATEGTIIAPERARPFLGSSRGGHSIDYSDECPELGFGGTIKTAKGYRGFAIERGWVMPPAASEKK